jgi:xanthine dehydrogenase YagS FAD-binding subunit
MAYRPWRAEDAERAMVGKPLTEDTAKAAAEIALRGAITHGQNDYKPELGRRTLVRALMQASEMEI